MRPGEFRYEHHEGDAAVAAGDQRRAELAYYVRTSKHDVLIAVQEKDGIRLRVLTEGPAGEWTIAVIATILEALDHMPA